MIKALPDEPEHVLNLNRMQISIDTYWCDNNGVIHYNDAPVRNKTTQSKNGSVVVYFDNLADRLIEHIRQSKIVVGCVAWLTSADILRALADVPDGVSIVVQKEDFLRRDIRAQSNWKAELRRLYSALKFPYCRCAMDGLVGSLSTMIDPTIDPIRCVGNHNSNKAPAFPRMHHKFLVFCDSSDGPYRDEDGEPYGVGISPRAVWTGSFNLSYNATLSLENAVLLTDPDLAAAYYHEWEYIMGLSESLDWDSEWAAPEWRIGS